MTQKSGPEGTLNYTYDSHGNLLGLQSGTSNGLNETFTYDADNRLSTFTDGRIGGTTNYGYDQDGNLLTLAYPNNVSTAYTYDTLDRLTGMNTQNTQSNSVVAAYAYTLRADGLRTGVTDSGPATSGRTDNWQYDPLDRLTQEAVTGASTVNGTSAFTYDSSNRLTRNSTIQGVSNFSETYNANDQRADEGFDNNGDTTGTNGNAYTFDAEGKLTGATLVTPTTESLTLTYDGDGNMVQKANGSVTTTYLVDTNNPSGYAQIMEAKTNGALTDVFNYGSAGIISQGHIPTGTTAYFGKDGSNNTRYLTDSQTGNVTDTMDYTADGILVNRTGNFPAVHQFQGEYLDPDLGLYDLRARWMNPQTGEFMTMDTYEGDQTDPQSLHKYAFVKWDGGVNQSDPSGHDAESGISQYISSLWAWINLTTANTIQTTKNVLGLDIVVATSHATPVNAATYFTNAGIPFLAPSGTDFRAVYNAGKANGKSNFIGIDEAIGHFGTYDFQRQNLMANQYMFYFQYVDASNFAVGDYMAGAGYSENWTILIAGTFAFGMSPNGTVQRDTPWWMAGWSWGQFSSSTGD